MILLYSQNHWNFEGIKHNIHSVHQNIKLYIKLLYMSDMF